MRQSDMNPSYLNEIKAFVEGQQDLCEWPAWWQENARLIKENERRVHYLKIKHDWREGACQILDRHDISYRLNESVNWNRCKECGEPLFHAMPGETTEEQIREFARHSNLPDKAEIERDGWLHPGIICPNGCTIVLVTYRQDPDSAP
jgi:hypothetical protein